MWEGTAGSPSLQGTGPSDGTAAVCVTAPPPPLSPETPSPCSPSSHPSLQFQTELRKILLSLIEVAQKLLALSPGAVELFTKANGACARVACPHVWASAPHSLKLKLPGCCLCSVDVGGELSPTFLLLRES